MLARLNVRTKLLVIMLPLLLAVGVLAGIGVLDRLDERSAASTSRQLLGSAQAGAEVVHSLQRERLDEVARAAGLTSPIPDTASDTDASMKAFRTTFDDLAATGVTIANQPVSNLVTNLGRQLDQVEKARLIGKGAGSDPKAVSEAYSGIIDSVMAANSALLSLGGSSENGGRSARWLAQATEADARAASDAAIVIGATSRNQQGDMTLVIQEITQLRAGGSSWLDVFTADTSAFGRAVYDRILADGRYQASQSAFNGLTLVNPSTGFLIDPARWLTTSTDRVEVMWAGQKTLLQREIAAADLRLARLEREVRFYLGGSLAALILGLLLAATVTRLITSSVTRLTTAARVISKESLPRLVDSLSHPEGDLILAPTPIKIKGNDEFSELADAFGAVEQAAMDVAAAQSTALRKGISDIFVNLARRNQSLLERQIEFIDRLETNEEDPDQLENLFKLDHLATRMRRNAESLLVLAGAETPRRRGRDVAMADVIRVAVGEVEDFARINLVAVDPVDARGTAAVDVAHLLSELMENGTQYSPPNHRVEVVGHSTADGGYVVSISDSGLGMSPEVLAEANQLLARPPVVGLSLSRSLGFIVAATLAARHRIGVRLTDSPSGGITAIVSLPPELLVRGTRSVLDLPATGIDSPISDAGHVVDPTLPAEPSAEPFAEPEWLQAAPTFDRDDLFQANFEVSDRVEPDPWAPTAEQEAERQVSPLTAFHLEGDPFAEFAEAPRPREEPQLNESTDVDGRPIRSSESESAPTLPVGSGFEAALHGLLDEPTGDRPVEPPLEEPGPLAPMPRRTTMWQAAERAPLPVLPGIPSGSMLPTSIPASVVADLEVSGLADSAVAGANAPEPLLVVAPADAPPLPRRGEAPTPIAAPMTPLLTEAAPPPGAGSLAEMTASLPTRSRPNWMAPASDRPQASSPSRPPDEVRSILSRYRKGLVEGRANPDETGIADQSSHDQPNNHPGASVAIES